MEDKKKLELIDTEEKFSLKIGGNEIPYITGYTITAKAKEMPYVDLVLELSIPRKEIIIESNKYQLQ